MTIRQGTPDPGERFDICVVGSGAAGLAVALACEAAGCTVVVLEAGGNDETSPADEPIQILDPSVHAPLDVSTRKRFGGTTAAWGGLCVPYDPIDFIDQPAGHRTGWPIGYAEMAAWHGRAAQFLDCGTRFEDETCPVVQASGIDTRQFGRLAHRATLGSVYRTAVARSPRVTLCLSAPVSSLACDDSGERVIGADVTAAGEPRRQVRARYTVVAAGGLRTTRLLLGLSQKWPHHFEAGNAPLGRYYMGHLTGEVATLVFHDPRQAAAFLYQRDAGARWMQRRLKLAPQRQSEEGLLGTAFTLRAPIPSDHRHGDGALSAIALLGSAALPAKYRASDRWRDGTRRTALDRRSHLRNIAKQPGATVAGLASMLMRARVKNLPIMTGNASGRYALRYHAEQAPNYNSRVYLEPGNPDRLVVDFRYKNEDFDSIVRSHRLVDAALRTAGIGYLDYHGPEASLHEAVRAQARDGYHQIGTTRMSRDPGDGIVDTNCRVHGLLGLYVASASVFPTSGSANPTLAVVAMALRLAQHLCSLITHEG